MRAAILAGRITVVRSGVGYVEDGDEVLDIVLWRLGYRPDSAWSKGRVPEEQWRLHHFGNLGLECGILLNSPLGP